MGVINESRPSQELETERIPRPVKLRETKHSGGGQGPGKEGSGRIYWVEVQFCRRKRCKEMVAA